MEGGLHSKDIEDGCVLDLTITMGYNHSGTREKPLKEKWVEDLRGS